MKRRQKDQIPAFVPDFRDRRVGDIAVSLAGHDAGCPVIIVAGIDERYVLVADGKRRKLSAPKKKKMQHIRILTKLDEKDTEMLREGKANDSFLRKKLSAVDFEGLT